MKVKVSDLKGIETFDIKVYLRTLQDEVESHLDRLLPPQSEYPPIIHEAMRYSVFAGGKRIRPILSLAAGEAVGGERKSLLDLACALELIHTYSLIHDDLPAMDNDDYRRGKKTSHRVFGEGIAILAGNALLTHAFRVLSQMEERSRDQAVVKLQVIECLCQAIGTAGGVIAGQVVDLITQGKTFSSEELEYIHSSKTGALIEASVYCAGLLVSAGSQELKALQQFGLKIGLAFQIVDDILDLVASSAELGKTTGKDRRERKATYPALHGIDESRRITEHLVEEAMAVIDIFGERGLPLKELARFVSVRRF